MGLREAVFDMDTAFDDGYMSSHEAYKQIVNIICKPLGIDIEDIENDELVNVVLPKVITELCAKQAEKLGVPIDNIYNIPTSQEFLSAHFQLCAAFLEGKETEP